MPHHHVRRKHLKPPIINRGTRGFAVALARLVGTFLRTTSIDSCCRQFLQKHASDSVQIVSLGAGYDTRFFRFFETVKPWPVAGYFEIDLESVTHNKQNAIDNSKELQSMALEGNLHSIPIDLSSFSWAEKSIHPRFDPAKPTLVLAECILMYLPLNAVHRILQYYSSLPSVEFVAFDPICGTDQFGQKMAENLQEYGVDDESFRELVNNEALAQRFKSCGFKSVCIRHLLDLETGSDSLHLVPQDARAQLQAKAALDEYEEWMLLARHYTLVCAQ